MPANLNALIRYKQIDLCLRNKFLKATIEVMQEKCSDQLAEHRGVYKRVSERTIRDDIRVMRSDALGFNAPIVVKDGVYSYEDKDYSIFNQQIKEEEILQQVLNLLLEERDTIKNPNLEAVLTKLAQITGTDIKQKLSLDKKDQNIISKEESLMTEERFTNKIISELRTDESLFIPDHEEGARLPLNKRQLTTTSKNLWLEIFDLI